MQTGPKFHGRIPAHMEMEETEAAQAVDTQLILSQKLGGVKVSPCSRGVCIGCPESGACIELNLLSNQNIEKEVQALQEKFFLVCPSCWNSAKGEDKNARPYHALYLRKERTALHPNPVVIVHRRNIGFFNGLNLDKIGLIDISHEDFAPFPFAYQLIDAAISTWDKDERLNKRVVLGDEKLYQSFCTHVSGKIKKKFVDELIVLLSTHSNDKGQLCWGETFLDAKKFFERAFTPDLRMHFKEVNAHLILMCCPGIFQVQSQYNSFLQLTQAKIFESVVGFPNQHDLKPFKVAHFASQWFNRVIRHRESYDRALPGICRSLPDLGHHTSVLVVYWSQNSKGNLSICIRKAVWCEKYRAPFGIQWQEAVCRQCRSFNSLKFERNLGEKKMIVRCRHAKFQQCEPKEMKIDGIYLQTPQGPSQSDGEWYIGEYEWNEFDSQSFEAHIKSAVE
ncbi:hypothetical protein BDP27DRAFT_1333744 [Rhodocollybia butyracea]|uniref:Uncharacterized protein n=1 Tax=Rhodocollybia butyracea TaxID=206335 RepID=A0A9P5PKI3_9AGAR|nr:hypothetical protein BDP27DRAFT_1333744 [Rhodocollybia butyracea]